MGRRAGGGPCSHERDPLPTKGPPWTPSRPPSSDRFDLLRIVAELDHSPTAASLLDRSLAAGVRLAIAEDAGFDADGGQGLVGRYDPDTRTVWVRRSVLQHDPTQAVQTLARELVHAVDRTNGSSDALVDRLDARYRSEGWNDDAMRGAQVRYHSGLVRESRAYVVQAQGRRELGLGPKASFHRAITNASTELGAYQAAWEQLATTYRRDEPIAFRDAPVVFMPGSSPEGSRLKTARAADAPAALARSVMFAFVRR